MVRCAVVLAVVMASTAARADVELELELGGSPSGITGVRGSWRFASSGTAVGAGGGLGLTGAMWSIGIDQQLYRGAWSQTSSMKIAYSIYASYAMATLAEWNRWPFGGREDWLYDGRYHWIDAGVAARLEQRGLYVGAGAGIAFLVAHPDPLGVDEIEDEDLLWIFTATGWVRQMHGGPTLWACVGVRL